MRTLCVKKSRSNAVLDLHLIFGLPHCDPASLDLLLLHHLPTLSRLLFYLKLFLFLRVDIYLSHHPVDLIDFIRLPYSLFVLTNILQWVLFLRNLLFFLFFNFFKLMVLFDLLILQVLEPSFLYDPSIIEQLLLFLSFVSGNMILSP